MYNDSFFRDPLFPSRFEGRDEKILERSEEEASGQREKEKGKKNDRRSLDQRVHVLAWSVRPPPIDLARA